MTNRDDEFDPDDNFAHAFDRGADADDDESHEALVWQLLLLVNPGDEEAALQQFTAWRDARVDAGGDDGEAMEMLRDVIDWKSGFHVGVDDVAAFIDGIDELVARWNLRIDWGTEDAGDDDFQAATDVPELMATAYDRLREHGYTLWTWSTPGGDGTYAGWIASSRDDEAMQVLAPALGIEVRPASDAA